MREFLSVAGIVAVTLFAAAALLVLLFIPMAYLDSRGCERKATEDAIGMP